LALQPGNHIPTADKTHHTEGGQGHFNLPGQFGLFSSGNLGNIRTHPKILSFGSISISGRLDPIQERIQSICVQNA
jgi:hypothetical protein